MPDGQSPRRPTSARPVARPAESEYEVVENNSQRPPVRAKPVQARPVPGTKPPPIPAAETVVTRKTAVTPKVPSKPKVAIVADEEDDDNDRPAKKSARDDDKPLKKRRLSAADRRRIREEKAAEEAEERAKALQEWVFPGILAGLGVLLTIISAFYHSTASADHAIGVGVMLVASAGYAVVMIPVTIMILMVVGKLCGIEYGSLGGAVRGLGGLLILLVGVYWTGALFGWAGFFLTPVIASIITYVLFLKLFDLDTDEARTTSGVMNFLTWVGNIVFKVLILSQMGISASQHHNDYDTDPDFDGEPPGIVVGGDDFGPDPGPPPPPKGKGKGKGMPRPPVGNDPDDFE